MSGKTQLQITQFLLFKKTLFLMFNMLKCQHCEIACSGGLNAFISFFNSKDPFVIIPFFADISDIESIEKLVYYYKSKAKQLQIDILIQNSAQEEIDNLYEDVVTDIVTTKGLVKTMNDNEAFLCKKEIQKDNLNEWESKYKDTMKKILDNEGINEKEKIILKHFIKQRFTKWFIQYKNKFEVSLTKINLYYE